MRIPSGVTDQFIYFVAVDATDFTTRETGLSSFTVYRSRNGGAAAAFTTPTINETDTTNMPGVYELLLDEDMTIDSGDDSQEVCLHITHAGMAPVTRTFELYRPKITAGSTSTAQTGDSFARLGAPAGASVSADVAAVKVDTAATLTDTAEIGVAGAGLTNINLPNQTMDIVGNITGNLSGSVGSVTGAVGSVTGAVGSVTGAVGSVTGNVGGNVTGSVGSVATGGITAASIANGAIDAATFAADVDAEIRSYVGLATANLDTQLADLPTNAELATSQGTADDATLAAIAALNNLSAAEAADAVWDEILSGHAGVGSTGAALAASGGSGDPWATALPGAYGAGTAGQILGDNVNATISSRATQTSVDDVPTNAELATALASADDAVLAAVAAVAADVWDEDATTHQTQGTFGQAIGDPGGNIDTIYALAMTSLDATISSRATQASVNTIDGYLDTEISAIKAKTDALPTDPADASDIATSFATVNTKLDIIDDLLDTEITAILADTNELQTDWANGGRLDLILDARASQASVDDLPTNAELTTALGTADDAVLAAVGTVDTVVDAIKVKTDSLNFTVAGQVDSNIRSVNSVGVSGDGELGTEWGPV